MQSNLEHAAEDALERYSMGTLPDADAEVLEEHLLVCAPCQNRLDEMDRYVRAIRAGLSTVRAKENPIRGRATQFPKVLPRLAWVLGAALVLAIGLWVIQAGRAPSGPAPLPFAVLLQAVRGGGATGDPTAPSGQPLVLDADLAGLPPMASCDLQVVDVRGSQVERLEVSPEGERLKAELPRGLREGRYWVRIYSTSPANELVREYALTVE